MSDENIANQLESLLRKTVAKLLRAEADLESERQARTEPIAVVSMGCRFAGGIESPEQLWTLLRDEREAMGPLPDRWNPDELYDPNPDSPGKSYAKEGGFVENVDLFDATFFGITPKEGRAMDPQQRIVLEVAWETLERAGLTLEQVAGSALGVYVGYTGSDYGAGDGLRLEDLDGYLGTGQSGSVLSGRVAYFLGARGPAVTVDTACSSSLVSLHLACDALRKGECDLALGGGVSVMSSPTMFVEFSRMRAMSPTARCRSFSADADGAIWSEGCGFVLLKRLSDAQRDGDDVLAVIRGSAMNQDGRSQGLTAPNGPAQQRLIRDALVRAGLSAVDIDAIEAHGTGTPLGDPIEGGALAAVFGADRSREQPLYLGSVKSNIGHTLAAAGIAGVLKMVLALRNGLLPKTLHAEAATPRIAWDDANIALLQEARPWPKGERPRRAGVSSFGISGTNAHLVLEEGPEPAPTPAGQDEAAPGFGMAPLLISGVGEAALRAQAERLANWMERNLGASLTEVVATAAHGRTHHDTRAALLAEDRDDAIRLLRILASGASDPRVLTGQARPQGEVVFVFPGQGSQWRGMGQALLDESPAFVEVIERCDRAFRPHTGWSILDVLRTPDVPELPPIERVDVVQPLLFSLSLGLASVWRSMGVEPTSVVGHSLGESAAAVLAGAITLEEGARIVAARSQVLNGSTCAEGAMAVIERPHEEVQALLDERGGPLSISAINTPTSTNISGTHEAVDQVVAHFEERGVFCRRIKVDHAGHCALMDPLLADLRERLANVGGRSATLQLYSTVKGGRVDGNALNADYWCDNLRQPVRFESALRELFQEGHSVFVELSGHPQLSLPITNACAAINGISVASLHRGSGDLAQIKKGLATLHVNGVPVDWGRLVARPARSLPLPTYAFQRQRMWIEPVGHVEASSTKRDEGENPGADIWELLHAQSPETVASTLGLSEEETEGLSELFAKLRAWGESRGSQARVARWLYDEKWHVEPMVRYTRRLPSGPVLFVEPEGVPVDVSPALQAAFEKRGFEVRRLALSALDDVLASTPAPVAALGLLPMDERPTGESEATRRGLVDSLRLLQVAAAGSSPAPVWLLTQGAVAAKPGDAVARPAQTACWGMGRVAALELPARFGGMLDLPESLDDETATQVVDAVLAEDAEDQVAVRDGVRFVRRLERVRAGGAHPAFEGRGTAMLTGGSGMLAGHLARWLVQRGVRHVVLASRSATTSAQAQAHAEALEALGARVTRVDCDSAKRQDVEALLARLDDDPEPLTVVAHLAGLGTANLLEQLQPEQLEIEMAAKAGGAWHLHELLGDRPLDAFILYGSGAALWGGGAQGAYAAANSALDGLARHRRARGLPALVVHWGGWKGGGMLNDAVAEQFARRGLGLMEPDDALRGLEAALQRKRPTMGVFNMDWKVFAPVFSTGRRRPLLLGIEEARAAIAADAAHSAPSPASASLSDLPLGERRDALIDIVRGEVAAIIGLPGSQAVDASLDLQKLGLDSVMAVALRNQLAQKTGLMLAATVAFEHRTCEAIGNHLALQLGEPESQPTAVGADVVVEEHTTSIRGADIAYEIRGEGEPLLLLHGWMGTRDDFLPFGDKLQREYRCIIPDQRGHGRSTDPGRNASYRECAKDMLELLDHLGIERCHSLGVSFGANILLELGAAAPERFASMVLHSGGTHIAAKLKDASRMWKPSDKDWEVMRKRHAHGDEQIQALWDQVSQRSSQDAEDDLDITADQLAAVKARTLIVSGDRDIVYPVEMQLEMYRNIRKAQLWIVPNGNHAPAYDGMEDEFAEGVLQFLRSSRLNKRAAGRSSSKVARTRGYSDMRGRVNEVLAVATEDATSKGS